jgi:hypothetical protein
MGFKVPGKTVFTWIDRESRCTFFVRELGAKVSFRPQMLACLRHIEWRGRIWVRCVPFLWGRGEILDSGGVGGERTGYRFSPARQPNGGFLCVSFGCTSPGRPQSITAVVSGPWSQNRVSTPAPPKPLAIQPGAKGGRLISFSGGVCPRCVWCESGCARHALSVFRTSTESLLVL